MNFAFSEEQEELRRTVRQFLESKSPETEVRRLMETDRGLRPRGVEADGPGARAAVARDSRGVRRPGLHLHRARHRARGDGPGAAVRAVLRVGRARGERDPQRRHRRPEAGAAARHRERRHDRDAGVHRAERASGTSPASRWRRRRARAAASRCSGEKMFVLDGFTADLIVVVARLAGTTGTDGISFFTVRRRRRRPHPHVAVDDGHDAQAGQARVQRRRRRKPLGSTGDGLAGVQQDARPGRGRTRERDDGRRAVRARHVGASTRRCACSSAVRSVRSRRSSTSAPTCCSRSSRASRPRTTRRGPPPRTTTSCRWSPRSSKAYCSEAYFHATAENIQIHGGIGFTWEHPAHLYFKRAKSSEIFLGDPTYHRELLAQRIGI